MGSRLVARAKTVSKGNKKWFFVCFKCLPLLQQTRPRRQSKSIFFMAHSFLGNSSETRRASSQETTKWTSFSYYDVNVQKRLTSHMVILNKSRSLFLVSAFLFSLFLDTIIEVCDQSHQIHGYRWITQSHLSSLVFKLLSAAWVSKGNLLLWSQVSKDKSHGKGLFYAAMIKSFWLSCNKLGKWIYKSLYYL